MNSAIILLIVFFAGWRIYAILVQKYELDLWINNKLKKFGFLRTFWRASKIALCLWFMAVIVEFFVLSHFIGEFLKKNAGFETEIYQIVPFFENKDLAKQEVCSTKFHWIYKFETCFRPRTILINNKKTIFYYYSYHVPPPYSSPLAWTVQRPFDVYHNLSMMERFLFVIAEDGTVIKYEEFEQFLRQKG